MPAILYEKTCERKRNLETFERQRGLISVRPLDPLSWQLCLLLCFVLGVLLCARYLWLLISPAWRMSKFADVLASLIAILLASLLGLEALTHGISVFTVCACGILLAAAHLRVASLRCRRAPVFSRPAVWGSVAVTLVATAWTSQRLYEGHLKLEAERINSQSLFGELEPISEYVAVTDRGSEVKLFRWVNYLKVGGDKVSGAVPTAAEDERANCHGWIFAGGAFFLQAEGVEQILKDNGYEPCQVPQTGDLIVYRDEGGTIAHTGVVQMNLLGRVPIIQS